jgi:hypothetical protein
MQTGEPLPDSFLSRAAPNRTPGNEGDRGDTSGGAASLGQSGDCVPDTLPDRSNGDPGGGGGGIKRAKPESIGDPASPMSEDDGEPDGGGDGTDNPGFNDVIAWCDSDCALVLIGGGIRLPGMAYLEN